MGLFEEAVLSAKSAVNYAGKKTGELIELPKPRVSAAEIEGKIKNQYESLGRSVYNAARAGTDATALVTEKAAQIDTLLADLDAVQEKISALRLEKRCPACGEVNAQEANFCQKCGASLKNDPPAGGEAETPQETSDSSESDGTGE